MKRILLYLFIIVAGLSEGIAQGPQFSQFYAAPAYLNPALTGNTPRYRFSGIYRNQWNAVSKGFVSYGATFDMNLESLNSGLGVMFLRDQAGTGQLSFTNVSFLYRYRVALKENLMLNLGMAYGVVQRATDVSRLLFSDQINTGTKSTTENFVFNQKSYGDFAFGAVAYSSKFWGGIAAYHLNRPNESMLKDRESRVPVQWSIHGGYKISIQETKKGEVLKSVTVTSNYKFQNRFDQLDIGGYYTQKSIILGVWYRGLPLKRFKAGYGNSDAVIPMIGFILEDLRMAYSYDITASKLSGNTAGSHEVSFTYEFPSEKAKKKKKRKAFIAPCPRF
jgi:type IX secretion system PorP/SprF family membrane protein